MAQHKLIAVVLLLTVAATAHGQTYWNEAKAPEADEILSTANELLCTYLNVNCPDNGSGFETPPAPSPPQPSPEAAPPAEEPTIAPAPVEAPEAEVPAPVPADAPAPAPEPESTTAPGRRMLRV